MVVGNVFDGLDIEDPADGALGDQLANRRVERRVAQDVADGHLALVLPHGRDQRPEIVLAGGKGFFQQHIVAALQQRQCGLHVLVIPRAVDDEFGLLGQFGQRFSGGVALPGLQAEARRRLLAAQRRGIGYDDDLQLLRVMLGVGGIGERPVSGADDDRCFRFTHALNS